MFVFFPKRQTGENAPFFFKWPLKENADRKNMKQKLQRWENQIRSHDPNRLNMLCKILVKLERMTLNWFRDFGH